VGVAAMSKPNLLHPQRFMWLYQGEHGPTRLVEWYQDRFFFLSLDDIAYGWEILDEPLERRVLWYQQAFREYTLEIQVPDEEWEQFWASINALGVWEWDKVYSKQEPITVDFQHWSIEISYNERYIESCGGDVRPRLFKPFLIVLLNLLGNPEGKVLWWF
jgi:hypothetical protein